jgi:hypothetical protein
LVDFLYSTKYQVCSNIMDSFSKLNCKPETFLVLLNFVIRGMFRIFNQNLFQLRIKTLSNCYYLFPKV